MTRLLFDHFGEKCLQCPEVGKSVDIESSGIGQMVAYTGNKEQRYRLSNILR